MFKSLMTSRKFAPLFWCQLCSALNDNFLKNALAMLIMFGLGGAGGATGEHGGILITVSGIVFIAPFFILSALGGELADRYDKAFIAQRIRLCEIPIAALADQTGTPLLGANTTLNLDSGVTGVAGPTEQEGQPVGIGVDHRQLPKPKVGHAARRRAAERQGSLASVSSPKPCAASPCAPGGRAGVRGESARDPGSVQVSVA